MKKNLEYYKNINGKVDPAEIQRVKKEIDKISCSSPIWISNNLIIFAQVSIFMILVHKINVETQRQFEYEQK